MTEDTHHAVRTNMESGSGMLNAPKSFFTVSTARYVPTTHDLLQVTNESVIDTLVPKSSGSKHKLQNFLILTQDLLTTVMETEF